MALEYEDRTIGGGETAVDVLNAYAAEGWRVHTAYTPTHFLMERGATSPNRQPQSPSSPTGNKA